MIRRFVDFSADMAQKHSQGKGTLLRQVGARIREVRKQKGLSQEGLALAAGLDRSYVGGVERGERNVSLVNLKRISDALSVPVADLLSDLQ